MLASTLTIDERSIYLNLKCQHPFTGHPVYESSFFVDVIYDLGMPKYVCVNVRYTNANFWGGGVEQKNFSGLSPMAEKGGWESEA